MLLKKIEELTDNEFDMLEEMAGTGFHLHEIASVIEVDADELKKSWQDQSSEIYRRHRRGFLLSALKLRRRIFKDAGFGSSPAQTLAAKILDSADFKMQS